MGVIRCPRCKQMYEFNGLPPRCCPECHKKEKDELTLVRNYVRSHPGAGVQNTSDVTGIPANKILQYVKDDRVIVMKNDENSYIKCRYCGKELMSGDLCTECKQNPRSFLNFTR